MLLFDFFSFFVFLSLFSKKKSVIFDFLNAFNQKLRYRGERCLIFLFLFDPTF